jgi:hypothetical protein
MKFRTVFWDVLPCKIPTDVSDVRAASIIRDNLKRRSTIILHGSTSQKTILNLKNNVFNLNFKKVSYKTAELLTTVVLLERELGSSVSTVSHRLHDRDSISGRDRGFFPIASVSRPALTTTQPPVQWVPGVLSLGVKRGLDMPLTTHSIKSRSQE